MITSQHPEWPAFKRSLEEMIERARDELELDQPESATAILRGQVAAYRHLIETIDPKVPPIDVPTYS